MTGEEKNPGITPRAVYTLFDCIEGMKGKSKVFFEKNYNLIIIIINDRQLYLHILLSYIMIIMLIYFIVLMQRKVEIKIC